MPRYAAGRKASSSSRTFSDAPLARVHFIIGVTPGDHAEPDAAGLEAAIERAARTWSDDFEAQLTAVRAELETQRSAAAELRASSQALAREADLARVRMAAIAEEREAWTPGGGAHTRILGSALVLLLLVLIGVLLLNWLR